MKSTPLVGRGIWKEETSWLRVSFLIGYGQGEVEVTGLAQLVCCLHAPVRRGLWLAVGMGIQEIFQNRISRKKMRSCLQGIRSRDGVVGREYDDDKLCLQGRKFEMRAGPLGRNGG